MCASVQCARVRAMRIAEEREKNTRFKLEKRGRGRKEGTEGGGGQKFDAGAARLERKRRKKDAAARDAHIWLPCLILHTYVMYLLLTELARVDKVSSSSNRGRSTTPPSYIIAPVKVRRRGPAAVTTLVLLCIAGRSHIYRHARDSLSLGIIYVSSYLGRT